MMAFLGELQKISVYNSFFKDKFSDENTRNFILEDEKRLFGRGTKGRDKKFLI